MCVYYFFYLEKSKCSVCLKNISLRGLHWLWANRLVHYLPFRWSCHLMLDWREKKSMLEMLKIFYGELNTYLLTERLLCLEWSFSLWANAIRSLNSFMWAKNSFTWLMFPCGWVNWCPFHHYMYFHLQQTRNYYKYSLWCVNCWEAFEVEKYFSNKMFVWSVENWTCILLSQRSVVGLVAFWGFTGLFLIGKEASEGLSSFIPSNSNCPSKL